MADRTQKLGAADLAPLFEASTWDGQSVGLADWVGRPDADGSSPADRQRVWLAFFRYASCPLCNLRVQQIIEAYPRLKAAGVRVVAVFQSPADRMQKYVANQQPPFALVADPDQILYEKYGLQTSLKGFLDPRNLKPLRDGIAKGFSPGKTDGPKTRIPADFLINPDRTIHAAYYGELISDHIPFDAVESFAGIA